MRIIKIGDIETEVHFDFIRSSGPGGQNVNKVATAAQLRFNIPASKILSQAVKDRLLHLAKSHIDQEGNFLILAHRFRSQERNRMDALQRFKSILEKASRPPKKRICTHPTLYSKISRIEHKKLHSIKKQNRSKKDHFLD